MLPDFGAPYHLIIFGLVALLVFKPQDLPLIMKKTGQFLGSAKRMAADFRASFEDMARQSELDQLRKEVEEMRSKTMQMASDPVSSLTDALADSEAKGIHDPTGEAIYDPAAWMGDDLNPVDTPAEPEPAPKPKRKPRAKAASEVIVDVAPAPKAKAAPRKKKPQGTA